MPYVEINTHITIYTTRTPMPIVTCSQLANRHPTLLDHWIPDLVRISLATRSHFIVLCTPPLALLADPDLGSICGEEYITNELTPGLNCRMRCF